MKQDEDELQTFALNRLHKGTLLSIAIRVHFTIVLPPNGKLGKSHSPGSTWGFRCRCPRLLRQVRCQQTSAALFSAPCSGISILFGNICIPRSSQGECHQLARAERTRHRWRWWQTSPNRQFPDEGEKRKDLRTSASFLLSNV